MIKKLFWAMLLTITVLGINNTWAEDLSIRFAVEGGALPVC